MKIDSQEVVFDPASVADPNGKVFWWKGKVYRAITKEASGLYLDLFETGIIERLIGRGLIETEITPSSLEGYELVLSHRTLPFQAYCFEWCNEMLKDAALLICDLNLELAAHGLMTQDAHSWNILYDGPTPKFVDFGSIVPLSDDTQQMLYWYRKFQDFFLYPLYLMLAGKGDLTRRLLFDLNPVISKRAVMKLLPISKQVRYHMEDLFHSPFNLRSREVFLKQLRRSVETIKFPSLKTEWSGYYDIEFPPLEPSDSWNIKHKSVYQTLKRLQPKTVVDVGSNRGWYSQLAANMGISTVAFDIDEICIKDMYTDAAKKNLSIVPLVMNISCPTPSINGKIAYYPPAEERLKADGALALAIVHHLVFKQGLRFDAIVARLAGFARQWLLVEFVPPTDRYVSEWYSDDFNWYSTQNFIVELKKVFSRVEVIDSFPAPRLLMLCER
jgi:hypothetical protein